MPSYEDPTVDAAEATEALRGVGHALGKSANARHSFGTLGELLALARRFTEVTQRLGTQIDRDRVFAADDSRNYTVGLAAARAAADALVAAAEQIDHAESFLDTALQQVSRIAWQSEPGPQEASRYVNIVFLQGEEADRIIDTIQRETSEAAMGILAGFDYGDETIEAALENGYVYDSVPVGSLDRTTEHDVYTMVYNPFMSHVGLYRKQDILPDPALIGLEDGPRHATTPLTNSETREQLVEQRRARLNTPQIRRAPHLHPQQQRGLGR